MCKSDTCRHVLGIKAGSSSLRRAYSRAMYLYDSYVVKKLRPQRHSGRPNTHFAPKETRSMRLCGRFHHVSSTPTPCSGSLLLTHPFSTRCSEQYGLTDRPATQRCRRCGLNGSTSTLCMRQCFLHICVCTRCTREYMQNAASSTRGCTSPAESL